MKPLRHNKRGSGTGAGTIGDGASIKSIFYSSNKKSSSSQDIGLFSSSHDSKNIPNNNELFSSYIESKRIDTPAKNKTINPELRKKDLEPWLNINKMGPKVKTEVIGLLPGGEYMRVPTERKTTKRSEITPFYQKLKQSDDIKTDEVILNMPLFLDLTVDNGGKSDDVKNKMNILSQAIKSNQKNLRNKFKDCPEVEGLVSNETFIICRDIYENNQVYYQQKFEDGKITKEVFSEKLSILEEWFICIIEPKPTDTNDIDDWIEREKDKLKNLYSSYCDPDIYQYLIKPSKEFYHYIKNCHQQLHF